MKFFAFFVVVALAISSCQSKTEQIEDSKLALGGQNISDMPTPSNSAAKSSLKRIIDKNNSEIADSLSLDSLNIGCYEWSNTYLATTLVEDEEGDQFKLYTEITLEDAENNQYIGNIKIYLSGCEEEMFCGSVKASAEKNYVTVFFDENIDGMEEMFKKGDKLVQFEISYGEYIASWFTAMNDYVDEYTVLSLQNR